MDISPDALLGTRPVQGPSPRRLTMALDRAEIREIAEQAAEATITRVFTTLGVDTTSPGAIQEMQRDFDFVRNQRQSAIVFKKNIKKIGWGALATVAFSLVTWALTAMHLPAPPNAP